jgi:DNA gyrase/topoisomerase IV subunit A
MINVSLDTLTEENMKTYGSYTIEDRALPDYRDGLKPVQRRILWAMYKMGLHYNTKKVKSARVSGEVMGKYHPHGDSYPAMVTLANLSQKLIEGEGNWGGYSSEAAASRYTECRLSKYSDAVMLDKECIAVTKMVPNYDNVEEEPLYLPSLLPNLLLNGVGGIATGTSTRIPPFGMKGLIKLVNMSIRNSVTAKDCLKYLTFNFPLGAVCKSSSKELLSYYKTGSGSLLFSCGYKVDPEKREMIVSSLDPYFDLERTQNKVMELDCVQKFENHTSKEDKYVKLIICFKRTSGSGEEFQRNVKKVEKILQSSVNCQTNITIRKRVEVNGMKENRATFKSSTVPEIINMWTHWRLLLETRRLSYRLQVLNKELAYQQLLAYAVTKLDLIIKILKKKTDHLDQDLAKAIKVSIEDATLILNRPTRSLSRLSKEKIDTEIKRLKKQIVQTKELLKTPEKSVALQLKELEEQFV